MVTFPLTLDRRGTLIGETRMTTRGIVPPFNVVEDGASRRRVPGKHGQWAFRLQRGEEALHRRSIPPVAFPTHADVHLRAGERLLIVTTRVLTPTVTGMQQPRLHLPSLAGVRQRIEDDAPIQRCLHRPAHHPARKPVKHDGQIQPAVCGCQRGDVGDPAGIGGAGLEIALQRIGSHRMRWSADRGAHA